MAVYLTNAFSLNMLPSYRTEGRDEWDEPGVLSELVFAPVTAEQAADFLRDEEWESCVGHADTAALFGRLLGLAVPVQRRSVTLYGADDVLLVGQYRGPRLPEGTTLLPEGAKVHWVVVRFRNDYPSTRDGDRPLHAEHVLDLDSEEF